MRLMSLSILQITHAQTKNKQQRIHTLVLYLPRARQRRSIGRQNVVIVLFQLSVNAKNPFENFSLHNSVRGSIEFSIPF